MVSEIKEQMVSEAIESYENALALVDDTSCESQMTRPVLHMKKGILLLQKFKDSNDKEDVDKALDSLATGLKLAEQCKGAQMSLLCADILEPVAELILTHPNEITSASLGHFQDGGRAASCTGLLQRVLQLRVDASGRNRAVTQSETLLKHLADLAAKQEGQAASRSATDEDMLLSCRVFDILAMSTIADQAQQGASSIDNTVGKVLDLMESEASHDRTAASAHVYQWGAMAIFSVLKHHGQCQAATAAQVVRVLTDIAKAYGRDAALSLAVCKALLPAMPALCGPAAGGGLVTIQRVSATNQAVSMLLAALEVHKDNIHVRREALQVWQSHTSTYPSFSQPQTHIQTDTHTQTHTDTHRHTDTQTHTCMHAYIHTHARTHI